MYANVVSAAVWDAQDASPWRSPQLHQRAQRAVIFTKRSTRSRDVILIKPGRGEGRPPGAPWLRSGSAAGGSRSFNHRAFSVPGILISSQLLNSSW